MWQVLTAETILSTIGYVMQHEKMRHKSPTELSMNSEPWKRTQLNNKKNQLVVSVASNRHKSFRFFPFPHLYKIPSDLNCFRV